MEFNRSNFRGAAWAKQTNCVWWERSAAPWLCEVASLERRSHWFSFWGVFLFFFFFWPLDRVAANATCKTSICESIDLVRENLRHLNFLSIYLQYSNIPDKVGLCKPSYIQHKIVDAKWVVRTRVELAKSLRLGGSVQPNLFFVLEILNSSYSPLLLWLIDIRS